MIDLLELCLEADKNQFIENLGALCGMLGKATQDPNPDMKNKCASFAGHLAISLEKKVGGYLKPVIEALIGNLAH